MGILFLMFVLHITTDLEYHLKQSFGNIFVYFDFYSHCRKVNVQFFATNLQKYFSHFFG